MKCSPLRDQANPFAYSRSFTLHTTYKNDMIGQNTQEKIIIKAY